jgi:hypothetical protein
MTLLVAIATVTQIVTVPPEDYEVTYGFEVQGGLQRILHSDDDRIVIEARRPTSVAEPSAEVVFRATCPVQTPSLVTIQLEAQCTGTPVIQRVEFYNFARSRWEVVDERPAPRFDTIMGMQGESAPAEYVEQGTRKMRVKIGYHDRGVTFIAWSGEFDQLLWGIVP